MDYAETSMIDSLLSDSERKAPELFHALVAAEGPQRESYAIMLADVLGNPGEFAFYLQCTEDQRLIRSFHLLRVFSENVELLVHRTWVNEADEKPKQILLEDVNVFIQDYREGKMTSAFRRFVSIARSIPSLLFGSAGRAPDFLEYAFRIDPKFGLFFWFVGELDKQLRSTADLRNSEELCKIETLIGAYVLSCF
ncbi:MAG: hypothetical protein LLF89_01200 [Spirochaetaceae bacterium]|nr:hypothetical protein [Spirochaetaceae bacterium]